MSLLVALALLGAEPGKTLLIDAATLDERWVLDIEYATKNNFTGQVLYPAARCLLRPLAGEMLKKAQAYLDEHHKGFRLMLKDCYRPVHVQFRMWEVVKGTPQQSYVANPNSKTGSIHNYGAAVDLTLADSEGKEIDMGTPYDHLGILSQPRHEDRFVREGKLTEEQVKNRRMLRDAMLKGGGFLMINNEWWHFNALSNKEIRARFEKLDIPLTAP